MSQTVIFFYFWKVLLILLKIMVETAYYANEEWGSELLSAFYSLFVNSSIWVFWCRLNFIMCVHCCDDMVKLLESYWSSWKRKKKGDQHYFAKSNEKENTRYNLFQEPESLTICLVAKMVMRFYFMCIRNGGHVWEGKSISLLFLIW